MTKCKCPATVVNAQPLADPHHKFAGLCYKGSAVALRDQ